MGGNTEEKGGTLLRNLPFSLPSPSYILRSWQLLAGSYLLLIRYEAVSSTPVMGLEMVALRSCEARDMIYPHAHTHAHTCKDVCACVLASLAASHQPSLTAVTFHPLTHRAGEKGTNVCAYIT